MGTSHETITKMTKELESAKTERDVQKEKVKSFGLKIAVIESTFIDKEKEVMAAREEALRTEREKNRTIESLKEQLSIQEKKACVELKLAVEQTTKKTKGVYKEEIEKIVKETSEVESRLKHVEGKYEIAKRRIADITKEKTDLEEVKNTYHNQMSKAKEVMAKLKKDIKETASKLETTKQSYQPLRAKVVE